MSCYLIDFENVRRNGFNGIQNLTSADRVFVFYSEHADMIPFDVHDAINESPATFKFIKVVVGIKNALDFQLCSHLGFLACESLHQNNKEIFYIVSNDTGFSVLSDYWKPFEVVVHQVSNLAGDDIIQDVSASLCMKPCPNSGPDSPDYIAYELLKLIPNKATAINWILFAGKEKDANNVNSFLVNANRMDTGKAGEIYRLLKKKVISNTTFAKEVAGAVDGL